MLQYREIFYKQYYSSQLGREESNYTKKLEEEGYQLRREIAPLLPQDKTVALLDIGCGIGSLVHILITTGYTNTIGVDISEEMVKVAHTLGIAQVRQGDINNFLEQHKNTFDVITGIDIIEHFTKDELVALLIAVKASLKPGGMAIFRTPNADAPFASIFANGDFTHENQLNASSARQVCINCGYVHVEVMSSLILIQNPAKEAIRKLLWILIKFRITLLLFATGRSHKGVVLTPNLLIRATKSK